VERAAPAGGNFPVLTKTNYYEWAMLLRIMLQARGLWATVSDGTTDFMEDRMALEVIVKAVPPEMLGSIASKPSARAAWESLILRNVGIDRVRKAKASTLRREFDSLLFHDGESLDDFGARIGRIVGAKPHSAVDRERDVTRKKKNSAHARCSTKRRSSQTACILA
jgi:hypothetical protein